MAAPVRTRGAAGAVTPPATPGLLLLAYLDAVPTERLLHSGASREEIQERQVRADELCQQIKDLTQSYPVPGKAGREAS